MGCDFRRAPYVGGNANNGANAGPVYVNTNNAASNANTNIRSQLCCHIKGDQTLPLGKKQKIEAYGVGSLVTGEDPT